MASPLATLGEIRSAIGAGLAEIADDGLEKIIDNMDAMIREYLGAHPTSTGSLAFQSRRSALFGMIKTAFEYNSANGESLPPSRDHLMDLRNWILAIYNGDNNRLNLPVILATNGNIQAINGNILTTGES